MSLLPLMNLLFKRVYKSGLVSSSHRDTHVDFVELDMLDLDVNTCID